jgi:hypothetical protein
MKINDSTTPLVLKDYYGKFIEKIEYKYFNLVETNEIGQYRTAELSIDLKHSINFKLNYKIDIEHNTDGKYIRYIIYRFTVDTEDPNKIVYYLKEELAIVAEMQTMSENINISEIFGYKDEGWNYIDNFADPSHIGLLNTVKLNADHTFSENPIDFPRLIYNDTGWEKNAQKNTTGTQTSQPSAHTDFSYNPNFWVEKPTSDANTWIWHWDTLQSGKTITVGSSTIYPGSIEFGPTRNTFKNYSMVSDPGNFHYTRVGLYVPLNNDYNVPTAATLTNTDYVKLKYKLDGKEYTDNAPKMYYTDGRFTAANKFLQRLFFEANRGANMCGFSAEQGFGGHWMPANNDHFSYPELDYEIMYDRDFDGNGVPHNFTVRYDRHLKNPDGTDFNVSEDSPLYRFNPISSDNFYTMMDLIKHINTNYINNVGLTFITMEYTENESWLEIHTNYLKDSETYNLSYQDFQITFDVDQSNNKLGMVIGGTSTDETRLLSSACYGYLNQFRTDQNESKWNYSPHLFDETHYKPYTPGTTIMNSEVMSNNKIYGSVYTIQNYWNDFGQLTNDAPYVPLRDKQKPLISPIDQIKKKTITIDDLYKYGSIININGEPVERYDQFDLSKSKTGKLQDLKDFYQNPSLQNVHDLLAYENAVISMDLTISNRQNNIHKEQITIDIRKFYNPNKLNLNAADNINIRLSDIYVKLLEVDVIENIKVEKTKKTLNQSDLNEITFNKALDYSIFNMPN